MDKLLEDDDTSGSEFEEDDPDAIVFPGFLNSSNVNNSQSNSIIPTPIAPIMPKKISVPMNGKVMTLNLEKAVVVTPSLLESLGGLPNKNNSADALRNANFSNKFSIVNNNNNNIATSSRLPQTLIGGQKTITSRPKQGIPIHPSGKVTKPNMKNGARIDATSLRSIGLQSTGEHIRSFKIVPNGKAAISNSTPTQLNGGAHFEMAGNNLVQLVQSGSTKLKIVGEVRSLPGSTITRSLLNGAKPSSTLAQPLLNGIKPGTTLVPSLLNGIKPGSTFAPSLLNGIKPVSTVARPLLNGTKPGTTVARPLLNGTKCGSTISHTVLHSTTSRPLSNGTILNRTTIPVAKTFTNSDGVRFEIGPSNHVVRTVKPVKSGNHQMKISNNGKILPNSIGQFKLVNKGGIVANGSNPINTRQIISEVVKKINANGNIENFDGVRFEIGPSNHVVRTVKPVKSGNHQMKISNNGKILPNSIGQFKLVNKGGIVANGSNPINTRQIISEVVKKINANGNIENFDSSGIIRFIEKHSDPNNGKRKLVQHDHEYDNSLSQKRNRVLEEEVENEEELGVAETYATYMPSKLKLGHKHPDPVVETASLSSVAPVDVCYQLSIPMDIIDNGTLSALQLESITYASQAHEQLLPDGCRAGFLIGDGAGVGKGRTIAGIILENFLKGRERAIWVSISNDLKYDAERDLADIGASYIQVHQLNKMKYHDKLMSESNGWIKKGVLFCTYSSLIGESNVKQGKYINRRDQILQWCKQDFDGVMVFDECHKAKNLCPSGSMKATKTGKMVLELQQHLPNARVLYASATGASEPKNMAYMVRLGLWGRGTTFNTFEDFTSSVEERGVGGMEIVAMDMKLRGMYIARQLSFQDVKFTIKEVPLTKEFIKIYNNSVKLWVDAFHKFTKAAKLVAANNSMKKTMWGQFWSSHQRFFKYLCIAAKVEEAVSLAHNAMKYNSYCVVIGLQSTGEARTLDQIEKNDGELNDFVSTAKGVFQSLVEKHFPSSNRDNINKILSNLSAAKQSNPNPNGYDSTNDEREWLKRKQRALLHSSDDESDNDSFKYPSDDEDENEKRRLRKQRERLEEIEKANQMLNTIFKPRKSVLGTWQEKAKETPALPTSNDMENANDMKEQLLESINKLGKRLPKNTLDELIDSLGGPENVAEMTGRKGRVVQKENGIQYESRSEQDIPLETLNVAEKRRFMDGEKNVAIISEAASSGISLQSDRRARNQKKRLHITLELPWSADKAVQQFGRTHRSNQVSAPEYMFLITDLAGERRFASIVAKRLESLGALTHGDRRAAESRDLSQFNIDNKYGKAALESVMRAIVRRENPIIPPPKDYEGNFFGDMANALIGVGLVVKEEQKEDTLTLDKEYNQIPKFLNRILGMPVELQNRLFKYFTDTMNAIISMAKRNGTFDLGILDLGVSDDEFIKRVQTITFLYRHATGIAPIELHKLKIEKGMSWEDATQTYRDNASEEYEGFYASHHSTSQGRRYVILLTKAETKRSMYNFEKEESRFLMYRPNTGQQKKRITLAEIEMKYRKVEPEDVKNMWVDQYNSTVCTHVYSTGKCRFGADCVVGLRIRMYHVLAGSVLPIWQKIEAAITDVSPVRNIHKNKMQVIRLKTTDNRKIVGTLIKNHLVEGLIKVLRDVSESVEEKHFPEE